MRSTSRKSQVSSPDVYSDFNDEMRAPQIVTPRMADAAESDRNQDFPTRADILTRLGFHSTSKLHGVQLEMYKHNLAKYRDNSEARKLITTCGEYNDHGGDHIKFDKRSVSTSKMMDNRRIWETVHDTGRSGKTTKSRNQIKPNFTNDDIKKQLDLRPISRNATYETVALDYHRQQRDFPGISNPRTQHQLEG